MSQNIVCHGHRLKHLAYCYPPPPPSDAAYLYTSNHFAGSLYWSFDTFNETGDGSYPNQNVNMSMYNAIPGLAVQQNYSISGNSIWTRFNGTDDCIDFGDFSGSCFSDPSLCTDGFALAFWIRLTEDEIRESGPVYIMSSGKIHWVCPRLLKSYLPYFPQTFVWSLATLGLGLPLPYIPLFLLVSTFSILQFLFASSIFWSILLHFLLLTPRPFPFFSLYHPSPPFCFRSSSNRFSSRSILLFTLSMLIGWWRKQDEDDDHDNDNDGDDSGDDDVGNNMMMLMMMLFLMMEAIPWWRFMIWRSIILFFSRDAWCSWVWYLPWDPEDNRPSERRIYNLHGGTQQHDASGPVEEPGIRMEFYCRVVRKS